MTTEQSLRDAHARMLSIQRAQYEAIWMIMAVFLIAGCLVADFLLGFRYSDALLAGWDRFTAWVAG